MDELQQGFQFTQADLEANREGRIGPGQLLKLLSPVVFGGLVVIVSLIVALYLFITLGGWPDDLVQGILRLLVLGCPGLFGLFGLIYIWQAVRDWLSRQVHVVSGQFSLDRDRNRLYIEQTIFSINARQDRLLQNFVGQGLTVYYLPYSKRILSVAVQA